MNIPAEHAEIERKFLVPSIPKDLKKYITFEIEQSYLVIADESALLPGNSGKREFRIRRLNGLYYLVLKIGSGLVRAELPVPELKISKVQYESLIRYRIGQTVVKIRHHGVLDNGMIFHLDIYQGRLRGLKTVEVEFKSVEESRKFIPPPWFGREITDDHRYRNQSLALYGLPYEPIVVASAKSKKGVVPRFTLKDGLDEAVRRIRELLASGKDSVTVLVAGGTSSGKTSQVAAKIRNTFPGLVAMPAGDTDSIPSTDDFYKGIDFMKSQWQKGVKINWDQPEAVDIAMCNKFIRKLKGSEEALLPTYDFKTGQRRGYRKVFPNKIIILEGWAALCSQLKDLGDVNIFVDISTHGQLLRRLLRDIDRTAQNPNEILKYFAETVVPMHGIYVESTMMNAGIVIVNEYDPVIEAQKMKINQAQLKFKGCILSEALIKLGADVLGIMEQSDEYYNPFSKDFKVSKELLRIRHEGNRRVLTYKGPDQGDPVLLKRQKFEFEIDGETEKLFRNFYGTNIKTIKKIRMLYFLDGVVFSLDKGVVKIEGGQATELGDFIEVRFSEDIKNPLTLLSKLGLDINSGIKQTYWEM